MRIQDKNSKSKIGGRNTNSIHACAESGDLTSLQALLSYEPSLLNEKSALMAQTPLHMAASLNRVETVKYLLDWSGPGKVELEAKNVYGETPLHMAAKNGCNETVTMLLNSSANIEARTNNLMTPLHLAVGYALRTGDNSVVKTLITNNADSSARDEEGLTPFNYLPAGVQNYELMTLLYQNVANQIQNVTQQIQNDMLNTMGTYSWNGYPQNLNQNIMSPLHNLNQNIMSPLYGSVLANYLKKDEPSGYQYNVNEPASSESAMRGKLEEFNGELAKIVGLHDLKDQLKKWAKGMLLDEKRRAMGLDLGPRKSPHMAFLGNPGTGKTTVARILGKLLHSVGVLFSDNVTEVQRSDLVAEYIGQTASKTKSKIEEAMGGILFVDEAYRLAPQQSAGSHQDYGVEALEEIMSVLEDGKIVVIFAGYTEPMKRVFSSNAGFCRRVTHFFQFDDFTCEDLAEMVMVKMNKQNEKSRLYGFKLHPSCTYDAIVGLIEGNSTQKLRNKMNGGLVDHMLNNARESLDSRLAFDSKGDELLTITYGDLEAGLKMVAQRTNFD